jgi:hypothetical protein
MVFQKMMYCPYFPKMDRLQRLLAFLNQLDLTPDNHARLIELINHQNWNDPDAIIMESNPNLARVGYRREILNIYKICNFLNNVSEKACIKFTDFLINQYFHDIKDYLTLVYNYSVDHTWFT